MQQTETLCDLSAEALLDRSHGQANTLYVIAGPEEQELLAPIIG